MANTINSRVYRDKYRKTTIDTLLRGSLVAEKVCIVDRSNNKRIQSPYSSTPAVTVQALAGTYTAADFTITDEALDVTDEFIVAEHVKDFEQLLSNFDTFASRVEQQAFNISAAVDSFVLNNLLEDGTGVYTTPVGGFTTAGNVNTIFANLVSKVAGYADAYYGNMFLVVENTDMAGIIQAAATNGFTTSDSTLNNGKVTSFMGIDVFVVRSGTFTDATKGTKTWTNAGHRVFGVKNKSTFAMPGGVRVEEKHVSGKTGTELVTYGYVGVKTWAPISDLIVDITLA